METGGMDFYQILLIILQFVLVLALVFAFYWSVNRRRNNSARIRLAREETLSRILDKFPSGQEAAEFLKSPEGKSLLGDNAPRLERPKLRALRLMQVGAVFVFIGLGSYLNAFLLRNESEMNYVRQVKDIQFWGTLAIALGAGLLFTALLTTFLVRRWGLNGEKNSPVR